MMTAVIAIAGRSISAGAAGRLPAPAVERGGLAWKLVSGVLLLAMIVGNDATRKPALFCEGGRCAIATPGAGHHSIASLIPLTTGAAKEAVRTCVKRMAVIHFGCFYHSKPLQKQTLHNGMVGNAAAGGITVRPN